MSLMSEVLIFDSVQTWDLDFYLDSSDKGCSRISIFFLGSDAGVYWSWGLMKNISLGHSESIGFKKHT